MKDHTNLFATIIIVPLQEILDNIYRLLSRGPNRQPLWSCRIPLTIHIPEKSLPVIRKNAVVELNRI